MITRILQKPLPFILIFVSISVYGQTFEGWVTYKAELLNPNPKIIPDSTWQKGIKEKLGDKGYLLQKYYYKQDKYVSEIEAGNEKGYQAYNPKDKLLYSWKLGSDTAITLMSQKSMDAFVEITESEQTQTIAGIVCKSVLLKSKMGQMTIWYNRNHLKMNAELYKGHTYGHWEQILKKIGCLPLKIEVKSFMLHMVQTVVEYKQTTVDDKLFEIPKFKTILENPVN